MKANVRKNKVYKRYLIHALVLFAVFSLVKVWQNVSLDQIGRRNVVLDRDLQQLKYDQAVMTDKLESLVHIDRIEKIARERLNMKQAEKINIPLYTREVK